MSTGEQRHTAPAPATVEAPSIDLEAIINTTLRIRDEEQRLATKSALEAWIEDIMSRAKSVPEDAYRTIKEQIDEIDARVARQLNEVLHHKEFQRVEATWRGLRYLVNQSETGEMLKIKVLDVSKKDLAEDLRRKADFESTEIYKKVYSAEYDMAGGSPYGVLIGDYEFSHSNADVEMLRKMSGVAAAAHAPFIAAASPEMFDLDDLSQLDQPNDLRRAFESADYAKWRSFRATSESRYVGLCLPHVLIREPYVPDPGRVESFRFKEDVDGRDHSKYLWTNAAYAFATRLTDAFNQYSWCAAIRGLENGGKVEDLPLHTFTTKEGDRVSKCPTEVQITDTREQELVHLGFMPLVHYKNSDYAVFFGVPSCHRPPKYPTKEAEENARLGAELNYLMPVTRIAHYLKALARDKVGSFMSRDECHRFLNDWITRYVTEDDLASAEVKAKKPLREARIDVEEIPGRPGAYRAVAYLRPHFQLDRLDVMLSLVAELPEPRGS
jgi:type VI secretion system protein ImpC